MTLERTKTVGQLLFEAEKGGNLNVTEISATLGISRQTYTSWKRGQWMGDEYVEVLADYLGIPEVDVLLARFATFHANPRSIKPADIEQCGEDCPDFVGRPDAECRRVDHCPRVAQPIEAVAA